MNVHNDWNGMPTSGYAAKYLLEFANNITQNVCFVMLQVWRLIYSINYGDE